MRMTENGDVRTKLELAMEYSDKLMELYDPNTEEDLKAIADEVERNGITLTEEEIQELRDIDYSEEDIKAVIEILTYSIIRYLND